MSRRISRRLSVTAAFEQLTNGELEAFRLGLLHGRMTAAEKQHVMADFRSGQTQVLVSTTVVEVGVDVPNATVITVAGAERFGLAQLHQLRGRVGRGARPGYCGVLVGEVSDAARERLDAFARSTDGFELAELDFSLRGPGDLFGTQQHGLPPLRIADLVRDREVLEETRREAQLLVADDPQILHPDHARLRQQMMLRVRRGVGVGRCRLTPIYPPVTDRGLVLFARQLLRPPNHLYELLPIPVRIPVPARALGDLLRRPRKWRCP